MSKKSVLLKQLSADPLIGLKRKINDTITVKVISTDNKGLNVQPEGCELEFLIKVKHCTKFV